MKLKNNKFMNLILIGIFSILVLWISSTTSNASSADFKSTTEDYKNFDSITENMGAGYYKYNLYVRRFTVSYSGGASGSWNMDTYGGNGYVYYRSVVYINGVYSGETYSRYVNGAKKGSYVVNVYYRKYVTGGGGGGGGGNSSSGTPSTGRR